MTLRWKTIGGLLLVAVLGSALALAFRGVPATSPTAAIESSSTSQFGSPSRGRIVPLVVDDGGLVPAFVPTPSQQDAAETAARPLPSLATIRVNALGNHLATPALATEFPRPLNLEPADALPAIALSDETFAPIKAPVVTAKPVLPPLPIRHTIVDGDTLPDLAERYLGNRRRADEIFEQNRGVLSSPDVLPLRVEIVIGDAR